MEEFDVLGCYLFSIGIRKCDRVISLVEAARTIASSYVSDGVDGEQIRPPAEVDSALAALPTGAIELGQELSDLVGDLELPVLHIARCKGVG